MTEVQEQIQNQENDSGEQLNMDDIFGMLSDSTEDLKTDKPAPQPKAKKQAEKAGQAEKKFMFPFQLYAGSCLMDITGYFEDGKEYSGSDITKIMLAHDEYFFTSKIEFDYMADTNTVVAMSVQHKKG